MRLARRDRLFVPWTSVATLGPLQGCTYDRVVSAVRRLVAQDPDCRLGLRLRADGVVLPADAPDVAARRVVVALDVDPARDYDGWASRLAAADDLPWPVAVVVARDHVALVASHAVGDGRWVNTVLPALVAACDPAVPVTPTPEGARLPFARAAARFVAADPARAGRTAGRVARVVAGRLRPAVARPDAARPDAAAPHVARPAARDPQAVYRAMPAALFTAVRAWRTAHAPGTSTVAVELTLLLRACAEVGLPLAPGVHVPYDLRRYLGPGAAVRGNFVAGVDLAVGPDDPVTAVGDALAEAACAGRPLTAYAARMLGSLVAAAEPADRPVHVGDPVHLAFSHVGRPAAVERLPWTPGRPRAYMGSIAPAGLDGLTVGAVETGGRLGLSASFHGSVLPRRAVEAALDLLVTHPLALLADTHDDAASVRDVRPPGPGRPAPVPVRSSR